jgi:hypothetical protein
MKSFWSSEQQSLTCYTLSPHSFAKIRAEAAAERLRKNNFSPPAFGKKTRGRFAKVAGLARIAAPTEAHRVRSVRLPVTATRSVNLPFENHIEFFGIDGLAGFQPINSLLYLKLPEKP